MIMCNIIENIILLLMIMKYINVLICNNDINNEIMK